MDITHDNVCSSMLSCFYSHLLSTGRPISSLMFVFYTTSVLLMELVFTFFVFGGNRNKPTSLLMAGTSSWIYLYFTLYMVDIIFNW